MYCFPAAVAVPICLGKACFAGCITAVFPTVVVSRKPQDTYNGFKAWEPTKCLRSPRCMDSGWGVPGVTLYPPVCMGFDRCVLVNANACLQCCVAHDGPLMSANDDHMQF